MTDRERVAETSGRLARRLSDSLLDQLTDRAHHGLCTVWLMEVVNQNKLHQFSFNWRIME